MIRPAVAADLPGIAALHAASWRDAYAHFVPAERLGPPLDAAMAARWTPARLDHLRVWLAEDDGPTGFVAADLAHPDGSFVDNLHVLAPARGRGTGRRLLATVAAAGPAPLWLWVAAPNRAARAAYAAMGAEERDVATHDLLGQSIQAIRVVWSDPAWIADPGR